MTRISDFSRAQYRESSATFQRWHATGRSTNPLDRAETVAVIREIYRSEGQSRPKVLFVASPAMAVMAAVALGWPETRRHLGARALVDMQWNGKLERDGGFCAEVYRCLRAQVDPDCCRCDVDLPYSMAAGISLWQNLFLPLRQSFFSDLGSPNPDLSWLGVCDALRKRFNIEPVDVPLKTFEDEGWLAQIWRDLPLLPGSWHAREEIQADYLRRIGVTFPPELGRRINLWLRQDEHCHWWFAFEGIAIVCERPRTLSLDERGRLHCETGPAIAYADGCSIYALNGVRVPEFLVERPDGLTTGLIDQQHNAEVRRLMLDHFGIGRYLHKSRARVIHEDRTGKLWRRDRSGLRPAMAVVEVINSTPEPDGSFKTYFLQVPPEMTNASAAVAWTFGLEPREYRPMVET